LCGFAVSSANASWYWPFDGDQPKQATPLATAPPLNQPKPATTAGSSGTSVLHPSTWSTPKLPWSSSTNTAKTPVPNKWAQTQPAKKDYPSPWQTVKSGTKHVENATASAWQKTVGVFTPAKSEPNQVAQQKSQPSWWSRMWGSSEEEKPEGPRTVGEFMAQKRLEP
jgi:hypothetical protein